MTYYTATVLDTTGIQDYIFCSNRLRENIGASFLVEQATEEWVKEALRDLGTELNQAIHIPKHDSLSAKPYIEEDKLAAELVYAGGGNTVLLFACPKYAERFTQILSKRVLEKAPGLNLVVAHKAFDWDEFGSLKSTVDHLLEKDLARKKRERVPSAPLLGLGVTAVCTSTQLPAKNTSDEYLDADEEDHYLISREVEAKIEAVKPKNKAVKSANEALIEKFAGAFNQDTYEFPYRTDQLGRSEGDSSYVAVVHADGNGMGDRFRKYGEGKPNRQYIIDMRELSQSVNNAGINALKTVIRAIDDSIEEGLFIGNFGTFDLKPIKQGKGKYYLPFRPLVYGGDDVTFVCDGRLGLELAAIYLQAFEKEKNFTACAGICVVKTHYPFARAYKLSEELCRKAKKFIPEERERLGESDDYNFSALDWHFAASGLLGSIKEIRQREYQVAGNLTLTMRPIRLKQYDDCDSQWRIWSDFSNVVRYFNGEFDEIEGNETWKDKRNKVIALREVLRQGRQKTKQFMSAYGIKNLPPFPQAPGMEQEGWFENTCGYFDAIEAMEFYLSLKGNPYDHS